MHVAPMETSSLPSANRVARFLSRDGILLDRTEMKYISYKLEIGNSKLFWLAA